MRTTGHLLVGLLVVLGVGCGAPMRRGGTAQPSAEGEGEEGEGEEGEGEEGEGEGSAEVEGEEGEGEGEGSAEGEGEGPAEGEGEGPPPDCVPRPETCNGEDDDCDGRTDEDDPELGDGCSTGLPGPCWQGRLRCVEGQMVCRGVVDPAVEVCDGLDNDCDGEADEDDPGTGEDCVAEDARGSCRAGATRCAAGVLRCDPAPPEAEACDGLDNDCNGVVDDDAPGEGEDCDTGELGECAAGTGDCTDGVFTCVRDSMPSAEECNDLDDDCDGETDEGSPGHDEPCNTGQRGVCEDGIGQCLDGRFTCVRQVAPGPELCDALDNDCDGQTDDGQPQGGVACELGEPVGGCLFGHTRCADGEVHCDAYEPSPEVCNDRDDDCDGEVDEDLDDACDTGELGVCAEGAGHCADGVVICARLVDPSPEVCDGLDNDCDGEVDEGPPQRIEVCELEPPVGECLFGHTRCEEGVPHCDGYEPTAEECNGLDDDCDGEVDEDDGQGECTRPNVMICGRSSRDVRTFFPADAELNLVNGCAPNEDTQALLMPRSAQIPAADVLRPYVEGGGIVITEYSNSHRVFSVLFEQVNQGARQGRCQDNIATVVQFTPDDPFWQENEWQAIPDNQTGCGHSVTHFPELVRLAGWSAQHACLGYRRLGVGRFWAVDVDWQDNERAQTDYTRDLFGYMIMTR